MANHSGLLILFDEAQRSELLQERAHGKLSFSNTLSVPDWKFRSIELCMLTFGDSTIDFIGLVRRGKRVATAKVRVEFFDLLPLNVSIDELQKMLAEKLGTK